MEGVPRIPMIGFPLKRSADIPDFKSKIKAFIAHHYNEDSEAYNQEISNFESLRAAATHVSRDFTGCATLKKYFCQLNFLKSRFPFHEGSQIATSFSWYDVYSDSVHGWKDIEFEMACILYNIGALHSELGTKDRRITADGMKTSCTHFQCAAWAFQLLKNDYHKYFSPDLSSDVLSIMTNVCLAQAQECILEKSLIDNRKSAITAKVSLQIVDYYQQTLKTIDVITKKPSAGHSEKLIKAVKKWRDLVETKAHYYGCLSYLYRGLHAEEQSKFGERITFFKAAVEKLNEATKSAKGMDKGDANAVMETLNFTTDVVGTKLSSSEKENEFVYHEKVPELGTVDTDFKGVSLVKGIPFKFDDVEISGPDIFARLVPIEAHEASSLYSEEKAKILRSYSSKIDEKNETLEKFLLAMQLDHLDIHSEENRVPQELVDCCAALSVNPEAVKKLSSLMSKLSGMFHDVEHNLKEIQDLLKTEELQEKEYQEIVGTRPPNNLITELAREVKKYHHAHTVASESNQALHEAMRVHVVNLQVLMKPFPEVLKSIPSISDIEAKDETAIAEMKRLRSKIDEMRNQREALFSQLRESILNDDITKSLVVKQDQDLETVFQEELKKHEKLMQVLDQNMLAQDNILRAVTEANAAYADTRRNTEELLAKREQVIQTLLGSYEAYNELFVKCTQGVQFYTKLDANVSKLLLRVRSACKVQEEEREERTNSILKKSQNVSATGVGYAYDTGAGTVGAGSMYGNYAQTQSTSKQETFDNSLLQQQYEKNLALQQQYEKNLSLQQEYEKLAKLTQQVKENSSQYPTSLPYGTEKENLANPSHNYSKINSTMPSYGTGTVPQYYASTVSTDPSTAQFYDMTAGRSYTSTTATIPQNVQSSNYAYMTTPSGTHPYLYSSPASPQTFVTNSTCIQPSYPSAATNVPETASILPNNPQTYPAPVAQYPVASNDNSQLHQYNNYSNTNSNNPLLQQYSQQYGHTPSTEQQSYGNYSILGQQSAVSGTYDHYGGNHQASGQLNTLNQYMPGQPGVSQQPQQQQLTSLPQHQTIQSSYSNTATNVYPSMPSGYVTMPVSSTVTAWNYTSPTTNQYPVSYPYSSDNGSYMNYYNQATGVAPVYTTSYVQPAQPVPQYHQCEQPQQSVNPPPLNQNMANAQEVISAPQQSIPVPNTSVAKMFSNIDLLASVDLSLPQAPLKPLTLSTDPTCMERPTESSGSSNLPNDNGDQTREKHLASSGPSTTSDTTVEGLTENPLTNLLLKIPNLNENRKTVVDHLSDPNALEKFTKDVENLQHTFEGFYKKSLNGPTNLDIKWKEVMDIQNAASIKMSISVARCYPMKNRYPDILPHDQTRVPLPCTKDDYINGSFVRDISALSIPFIATQAPLPVTFSDFWHMIWYHHIELIVCLCSDTDLKEHIYWPLERGKDIAFGPLHITLQSKNAKPSFVERIFSVTHRDLKQTRVAIHLQFKGWSSNVFPDSPGPFLGFINEVHSYFLQQRSLSRPIVVHCMAGVGKTGVFIILSAAIREIQTGKAYPDLSSFAGIASEQRKGIMNDKEYLRFAYQCLLYYCQDLLMKRGILSARSTFDELPKPSHTRHPSQDFLTESIKKMVKTESEGEEQGALDQEHDVAPRNTSLPCTPSHRKNSEQDLSPPPRPRIYSDVPASLVDVEMSTFHKYTSSQKESIDPKRNDFESRKGALTKKHEITTDPLDTLDPLWTMKK